MPDLITCMLPSFQSIISHMGLIAGILTHRSATESTYTALCSVLIPLAPFNGAASGSLTALLLDCHMRHPAPHVHSLKSSEFWKQVSSICDTGNWQKRGLFIPFVVDDDALDFLLFSTVGSDMEAEPSIIAECETLASHAAALIRSDAIAKALKVTEHYVKELGHDLASSVQAIIPKIRNVRTERVTGALAAIKLEEVEAEIMSISRSSDTMGITVDPQYNIQDGDDFSILKAISSVITLCGSETTERHITIETEQNISNPMMWGDRKAVESAITQLVINAIKYARGSSKIYIRCNVNEKGWIRVSVVNLGISIAEEFLEKMWEFGERGREALELHANGSGIGLFTVRKIVRAHGGTVEHKATGEKRNCNIFSFSIPRRDFLAKEGCFR